MGSLGSLRSLQPLLGYLFSIVSFQSCYVNALIFNSSLVIVPRYVESDGFMGRRFFFLILFGTEHTSHACCRFVITSQYAAGILQCSSPQSHLRQSGKPDRIYMKRKSSRRHQESTVWKLIFYVVQNGINSRQTSAREYFSSWKVDIVLYAPSSRARNGVSFLFSGASVHWRDQPKRTNEP